MTISGRSRHLGAAGVARRPQRVRRQPRRRPTGHEAKRAAPSENTNVVRSIYLEWERGSFGVAEWVHPEIEYAYVGGPAPSSGVGVTGASARFDSMLDAWEEISFEPEEYLELDDERVLVLVRISGRGKMSGVRVGTKGAGVCHVGAGKITRIVSYWDRDRAFADLGLVAGGVPPG